MLSGQCVVSFCPFEAGASSRVHQPRSHLHESGVPRKTRNLSVLICAVGRCPGDDFLPHLSAEDQTLAHIKLRVDQGVEG